MQHLVGLGYRYLVPQSNHFARNNEGLIPLLQNGEKDGWVLKALSGQAPIALNVHWNPETLAHLMGAKGAYYKQHSALPKCAMREASSTLSFN